jgi:hypothetical protein
MTYFCVRPVTPFVFPARVSISISSRNEARANAAINSLVSPTLALRCFSVRSMHLQLGYLLNVIDNNFRCHHSLSAQPFVDVMVDQLDLVVKRERVLLRLLDCMLIIGL